MLERNSHRGPYSCEYGMYDKCIHLLSLPVKVDLMYEDLMWNIQAT